MPLGWSGSCDQQLDATTATERIEDQALYAPASPHVLAATAIVPHPSVERDQRHADVTDNIVHDKSVDTRFLRSSVC